MTNSFKKAVLLSTIFYATTAHLAEKLTWRNHSEIIQSDNYTLVLYGKSSCPWSVSALKEFKSYSEKTDSINGQEVNFGWVYFDDPATKFTANLTKDFTVPAYPTFVSWKKGKIFNHFTGAKCLFFNRFKLWMESLVPTMTSLTYEDGSVYEGETITDAEDGLIYPHGSGTFYYSGNHHGTILKSNSWNYSSVSEGNMTWTSGPMMGYKYSGEFGEIQDGTDETLIWNDGFWLFEGQGSLEDPTGIISKGTWKQGELIESTTEQSTTLDWITTEEPNWIPMVETISPATTSLTSE